MASGSSQPVPGYWRQRCELRRWCCATRWLRPPRQEVLAVNAGGGDPAAVQRFLSGTTNINAALASPVTISYQGQVITPAGSLATLNPAAGGNGNGA